jgi:hypothetical protein
MNRNCKNALLLSALLPLAACDVDSLLEAKAPSRIPADEIAQPQFAGVLLAGAIGDFECAWGARVLVSGILGDEFADAQLGSAGWSLDRRAVSPNESYGTSGCATNQTPGSYIGTSTARWSADNLLTHLEEWTPDQIGAARDSMIATAAAFSGLSHVMLGTDFCTAAVDLGPELQPAKLFEMAEAKFDKAIEFATKSNSQSILNLARLGRARARLYRGNKTGAAADARLIPENFVYNATASDVAGRRQNRIFAAHNQSAFYTIAPESRAITTQGVADPRTRVTATNIRSADGTLLFAQNKYANLNAPLPIARWAEAQLIIAEAEGGQAAIDAINRVRAKSNVPALTAAETANLTQTIIDERRKELFLEGARMWDITRFNVPFSPATGSPFVRGGFYGDVRCLPLPDVERLNNPNIAR